MAGRFEALVECPVDRPRAFVGNDIYLCKIAIPGSLSGFFALAGPLRAWIGEEPVLISHAAPFP
jgi:hypothetical protein